MSCEPTGDHRRPGRQPGLLAATSGSSVADRVARLRAAAANSSGSMPERRRRCSCDQSPVRASSSSVVEALVSSVPCSPGEPVRQQVGDEQQPSGGGQLGRATGRGELVERVERQRTAGRCRVQLRGAARVRAHLLGDAARCGRRGSAPGCRAAPRRRRAARSPRPRCRCRSESTVPARAASRRPSRTPAYSAEDVPVQARRAAGPAGWGTGAPRSAPALPGPTRPTMTRPLDAPRSTAANACHAPSLSAGRRPRRRRRPGRAARWCGSGRRRSARTRRSATCSGSTSRLSRVRWA